MTAQLCASAAAEDIKLLHSVEKHLHIGGRLALVDTQADSGSDTGAVEDEKIQC